MCLRCSSEQAGLGYAKSLFGEIQPLSREGQPSEEFAFIAPAMAEREINAKIANLEEMRVTISGKIRVLDY